MFRSEDHCWLLSSPLTRLLILPQKFISSGQATSLTHIAQTAVTSEPIWGYKWNPLSSGWNPQVIICGANMGWGTERPGEEFGWALFILENPLSKAVLFSPGGERRGHRGTPPARGGSCRDRGFLQPSSSSWASGGKVTSPKWGFSYRRGARGPESSYPQMKMMWPYLHHEGWGAMPEHAGDEFICPSVRRYFNLYVLSSVWLQWTRSPADVSLSSFIKIGGACLLQLGTTSMSSGI